jgi:hypothetical protein
MVKGWMVAKMQGERDIWWTEEVTLIVGWWRKGDIDDRPRERCTGGERGSDGVGLMMKGNGDVVTSCAFIRVGDIWLF